MILLLLLEGHGALYHSQSPEAYFCHTPVTITTITIITPTIIITTTTTKIKGLRVVIPSCPSDAKGYNNNNNNNNNSNNNNN